MSEINSINDSNQLNERKRMIEVNFIEAVNRKCNSFLLQKLDGDIQWANFTICAVA